MANEPETDLDEAHAVMARAPEDDAARLRFYERLADSEIFMLLSGAPEGDSIKPEIFEISGEKYALIFDREDRLTGFVGRAVPYAGLPGRALVGMFAGQGVGLALNLEVASSSMLIPGHAVDWLAQTLSNTPDETQARLLEVAPPIGLPQQIITGLDRKLAIAAGLAKSAYLAAATYEGGRRGHVLAFVDAAPGAEAALAHAAGEALTFSGIDVGVMDVLFAQSQDQLAVRLSKVGLRFDLPQALAQQVPQPPGGDPEKPPRLR